MVDGQALASSPFNASGVLVRGIRADDLNNLTSIAKNIKQGTLEGFDDGQGVAIGRRLADQLSLHAGDSITLVAPKGAVTPMGTTPRIKPYKVAAVFEIGMSEYDLGFVFMPLAEAQAYFNRSNDVTAIEVFTTNPDKIDAFRKAVTEAAGRPVFLVDWRQRNSTFFNALQVERNVMFLILTMIVLVAALNIVSGLIMLVKDKGSDIAILRTMGASQGSIMRIFLITGASIGVVGTLAGFFVGLRDLPQHRIDPAIPVLADQHRAVLAGALLPVEAAGRDRRRRDHGRRDHGADAVVPGDAVSVLARRAPRSRRSAAVRVRGRWQQGAEDVPVIYLHEIKRQYMQGEATLTILDGAKLALWAGQSVALVAPSGSGKSTLLHIAGLLEAPDDGEVYVGGRADLAAVRRRAHPDPPHRYRLRLSVAPAAAGILGAGKRHAAADDPRPEALRDASSAPTEILAYLGLGDRITHRPAELSGGEQQRVAIARAVANAPRVLFADEPTGNLDPHTADHVFSALMQLVKATRVAMLIATHNMELAGRMDRRVSLANGQVVELGLKRSRVPPRRHILTRRYRCALRI